MSASKAFQEGHQVVVELGLNLQNQDRSFLCNQNGKPASSGVDDHCDGGGDNINGGRGPTCNAGYSTMMKNDTIIYDATPVVLGGGLLSSSSPAISTGVVRSLQPFDASYPSGHPFFKTSSGGVGMATAAMGFPFTAAQWKELERQAMIYKYMVASLPVPPDLLYSSFTTNLTPSPFAPTSYLVGKYGNGLNLRWVGNGKDAEPGRCRRTDGKKWRCSRDVAPNQKYCERHMHRGRPRSRKPVELLHNPLSDFTTTTTTNKPTKKTRLSDPNTQPGVASSFPSSVQMSKGPAFDHPVVSTVNPFEDSRSLAWAEEQQWQQLVQTNMNPDPSVFQQQFEGEPLNLNSDCVYNPKSEMGLLLERPLIDAWSMGLSGSKENYGSSNNKAPFSNGGHHGNSNGTDENMCQIQMGLGVIDSWVGGSSPASPGGPLGEVLRPGSVVTATGFGGGGDFVTPPATAVSSPSGVLQKTHASFSDSSGSSSPTTYHNATKAKSEMPFQWLN